MADDLEIAKQRLETARGEANVAAERLAGAKAAHADAEAKRRDYALRAVGGDQAASKALKAATRDRDDAEQLIEDCTLASEAAQENLSLAAAEADAAHYTDVREKIIAQGGAILDCLPKIREIAAQFEAVAQQMRKCDLEAARLIRTQLIGSGRGFLPQNHAAYIAAGVGNQVAALALLSILSPELRTAIREAQPLAIVDRSEPVNLWALRIPDERPTEASKAPATPPEDRRPQVIRLADGKPVTSIFNDDGPTVTVQGPDFTRPAA